MSLQIKWKNVTTIANCYLELVYHEYFFGNVKLINLYFFVMKYELLKAMEVSTGYEVTEESSSLQNINIETIETVEIREEDVIQGTALLRLYCAIKRLAGMKLNQQESEMLLRLVTCHPPPTAAGVRFVVVGLCTLLVCTNITRLVH